MHAIDTVLNIGVLIADVDLATCRRILRDAGRLQQNLVDWRFSSLWQRIDRCAIYAEGTAAEMRRQIIAQLVEPVVRGSEIGFWLGWCRGNRLWPGCFHDNFRQFECLLCVLSLRY